MSTPTVTPVTPADIHRVLHAPTPLTAPLNDIEQGVLHAAKEQVKAARSEQDLAAAVRNLNAVRHMVVGWVLGREAAAARRAARAG